MALFSAATVSISTAAEGGMLGGVGVRNSSAFVFASSLNLI
jgi:hypothetical protein